jgi:hypothetical protein
VKTKAYIVMFILALLMFVPAACHAENWKSVANGDTISEVLIDVDSVTFGNFDESGRFFFSVNTKWMMNSDNEFRKKVTERCGEEIPYYTEVFTFQAMATGDKVEAWRKHGDLILFNESGVFAMNWGGSTGAYKHILPDTLLYGVYKSSFDECLKKRGL